MRGIQSKHNRESKLNYLLGTNFDVLCIQELRLKNANDVDDVINLWSKGSAVISIGQDLADGVGILFKNKDVCIIKRRDIIPGRLLLVDCVINSVMFRIINVYTSQRTADKTKLFRKLQELCFTEHNVVLCGDFNTITEENDRISSSGLPFRISSEGKCLKDVTNNVGMCDVFRTLYPNDVSYSRFESISKTRIDRIYISKALSPINYSTCFIDTSDHLLVASSIAFGENAKRGYWKLNIKLLEMDDLITELKDVIANVYDLRCLAVSDMHLWEIMKSRIRDYLKFKSKMVNIERNKRYDQITKILIELKCKRTLSDEETKEFKKLKKEVDKFNNEFLFNIKKEAGFCTISDDGVLVPQAITLCKKRREKRHLERVTNKEGVSISNEKEKRKAVHEICTEMYKQMESHSDDTTSFLEGIEPLSNADTKPLLGDITKEEVVSAINQLNAGKSPGLDGLPAEVYKLPLDLVHSALAEAFNYGIKNGIMGKSFYQGVMTLLYKKGDRENIENYRHLTLMNVDYKILAKVLMNRMMTVLDKIIQQEQTCAIKGRIMMDNLCTFRDIISSQDEKNFYIIGLDQKKAFDYVSRDYLWKVMESYGFPQDAINMCKLLYRRSTVQVNVNGVLTEPFEIERGVKQGCPLSAALYTLAINPLLKRINNDAHIQGTATISGHPVVALAYADDISVIVRNQKEMDSVNQHFELYERVAGAKLNQDKTEGVWMGQIENRTQVNIVVKDEIKILGLYICPNNCCEKNWEKKVSKLQDDISNYAGKKLSFQKKIDIQKTYLASPLIFLATIFPPPRTFVTKINKLCVNFIWGTKYEIMKRNILFRARKNGGLGAIDLDLKLKIAFIKNISNGIQRKAPWVGDPTSWCKKYGRNRMGFPAYKLLYGDFVKKYECLNIDWSKTSCKIMYSYINEKVNGGLTQYEGLGEEDNILCLKNLSASCLSQEVQDRAFLIAHNKLPVRQALKWCNKIPSTECPIPGCSDTETLQHFLCDCILSSKVWSLMKTVGFNIDIDTKICKYGIFPIPMSEEKHNLFWWLTCTVIAKLWKYRCMVSLSQIDHITAESVFQRILTSMRRARSIDTLRGKENAWRLLLFF